MRIVVHDYSGHPFQAQLSRELARRGHQVAHIFSASFQTPKGRLQCAEDDPRGLEMIPVRLEGEFRKDSLLRRRAQEIEYGRLAARAIAGFRPDIVVSSNTPLDAQRIIQERTRAIGARFVFWLQDIYSEAIGKILSKRFGLAGSAAGYIYKQLEYRMLRSSDAVVSITSDFEPILTRNGVRRERITTIENWAPLDEIVPQPRDNRWARSNMPHAGLRVVYSGTLGYKHNPQLLLDIARVLDGHVYVFSEGAAAGKLATEAVNQDNLSVESWVPFGDLPAMLSGADIFVAMIGQDAGTFSVPSKVLSYLCIGKPILACIPKDNLARRLIEAAGAGIVVEPGDRAGLIAATRALASDPTTRFEMGMRAREYAAKWFDIKSICDRFEVAIRSAAEKETGANEGAI